MKKTITKEVVTFDELTKEQQEKLANEQIGIEFDMSFEIEDQGQFKFSGIAAEGIKNEVESIDIVKGEGDEIYLSGKAIKPLLDDYTISINYDDYVSVNGDIEGGEEIEDALKKQIHESIVYHIENAIDICKEAYEANDNGFDQATGELVK